MPRLLRKEEGVLRKLKQQEAEIKHLEEAQKRASQHRKHLLLQQQDISRFQQSAQQYKEKIKRYRITGGAGLNLDYSPSPSPTPSLDFRHDDLSDTVSLPESPLKSSSIAEDLLGSFSSSRSSPPPPPLGVSKEGEGQEVESPVRSNKESRKLLKLKELSNKKERDLKKFEKKLLKRRQTAEELLSYKEELLKKEKELKEEENEIDRLIEDAISTEHDSTTANNILTTTSISSKSRTLGGRGRGGEGEISEEIEETTAPSSYTSGSFETDISGGGGTLVLTSTPHTANEKRDEVSSDYEGSSEQERRLIELQQQLQLKEQELKRRKMETVRAKKEILTQQEEAIQARLKEVEEALNQQQLDTLSTPLITVSPAIISEVISSPPTTTAVKLPPRPVSSLPSGSVSPPTATGGVISSAPPSVTSPIASPSPPPRPPRTISPSPPPPPPHSASPSPPPPPPHTASPSPPPPPHTKSPSPRSSPSPPPPHSASPSPPPSPHAISPLPTDENKSHHSVSISEHIEDDDHIVTSSSPIIISPIHDIPQIVPQISEVPPYTSDLTPQVHEPLTKDPIVLTKEPITLTEGPTMLTNKEPTTNTIQQPIISTVQDPSLSEVTQSKEQPVEQTIAPPPPPPPSHITPALTQSLLSPRPSPSPLSLTPDIPDDHNVSTLQLGQRVLVANKVHGTIRYIGCTGFASGLWVGIELDEGRGKNDGSVNDQRYFSCPPNHGLFAPPSKVVPIKGEEEEEEKEESLSGGTKSISEEIEEDIDEEDLSSPPALSPVLLPDTIPQHTDTVPAKEDMSDSLTSVSQLTEEGDKTLVEETMADNLTGELVRKMSDEAFETVHEIWKDRKKGKPDHNMVDTVTDQLLSALVQSEVDLICNIRDTREALIEEEKARSTTTTTTAVVRPHKERGISFSSEPLALVPSSRHDVNIIVEYAWNTLLNDSRSSSLTSINDTTCTTHPVPAHLLDELCNKSGGVMLTSERDFVRLVYDLAMYVIRGEVSPTAQCKVTRKMSSSTLAHVQDRVHHLLHQGKRPHSLPPLRYLHNNCRPGGKEVDFVDTLLLSEMRSEEATWVDYQSEEENIHTRTTDEILNFLLDETLEVIQDIYNKRQRRHLT